jgi:hypothetical protein
MPQVSRVISAGNTFACHVLARFSQSSGGTIQALEEDGKVATYSGQEWWVIRQSPHPEKPEKKVFVPSGRTIYLEIAHRPRLEMPALKASDCGDPGQGALEVKIEDFPVRCWRIAASRGQVLKFIEKLIEEEKDPSNPIHSDTPQAPLHGRTLEPWQDAFFFDDFKCKDCLPTAGTPVPKVEGMSPADARTRLAKDGFTDESHASCMATPPPGGEGTVAVQRPDADVLATPTPRPSRCLCINALWRRTLRIHRMARPPPKFPQPPLVPLQPPPPT